jgi:hypothetical protein
MLRFAMGDDNVTFYLPLESTEAEALQIAQTTRHEDRLFMARLGLAWTQKVDRGPTRRRTMMAFCRRLVELELAALGDASTDIGMALLHDADGCPAESRIARARAVLQTVLKKAGGEPQAPRLALEYVRRLIELEMLALDDQPASS